MIDELKKIGLSENEARVYLALLELGSATAQQIAQKATVNRPTTYVQLDGLMKLGLVSSFEREPSIKGGASKTFFRIENPTYLKKVVEVEKQSLSVREKILHELLPNLEQLYSGAGERPRVRFFEGTEGLKTTQDEFLKTKDKLVESAASLDDVLRIFPTHPEDYAPRRVQRGIHSKLIYTTARGAILKDADEKMLRESLYVPPEQFPFSSDLAIYGDNVVISVLRNKPYSVIIESKEIANSIRALFYLAWEQAKKYN